MRAANRSGYVPSGRHREVRRALATMVPRNLLAASGALGRRFICGRAVDFPILGATVTGGAAMIFYTVAYWLRQAG